MDRLEENFDRFAIHKNRDPGVNSDEEDEDMMMMGGRDDMFQFDRLSHCSSSLRSELSLSRLGTVSPANSTPDIEAMRRPSKNQFETRETAVNEVQKRPSNFDFEATRKPNLNSDVESVRNTSQMFETNINTGWKGSDDSRRIGKNEEMRNTKEGEISVEKRMTSEERPPSAETVAEDYSLPSYHQVTSNHSL